MACALAIVGLGISAAGTVGQQQAAQEQKAAINRQTAAQKEQAALSQRQADIANARQLRAQIRQRRIAEAAIVNAGANAGTQFSSGVQGGLASLGSQTNSNISYINETADINRQITGTQVDQANAISDAANAQADSATYGAIGQLGGGLFNAGGGYKTIFGIKK